MKSCTPEEERSSAFLSAIHSCTNVYCFGGLSATQGLESSLFSTASSTFVIKTGDPQITISIIASCDSHTPQDPACIQQTAVVYVASYCCLCVYDASPLCTSTNGDQQQGQQQQRPPEHRGRMHVVRFCCSDVISSPELHQNILVNNTSTRTNSILQLRIQPLDQHLCTTTLLFCCACYRCCT